MKILLHTNAPHTGTGYGVQCALLAERLHDDGFEVAVSATWGQQGGIGGWRPKNPRNPELWPEGDRIRVYPVGWALNGVDIVHNHAMHFFDGDPLGGWIIVLGDVWSMAEHVGLTKFNVLGWAPVDHFPVPPAVLQFFETTGAEPVAMSRFGEQACRRGGLDPAYVPLAVDLDTYKPTPTIDIGGIEANGRMLLGGDKYPQGIPENVFLVGMVAMNKDPDDRKGFCEAFSAFSAFHRRHGDSILYVHTDPLGMGSSFNLETLALASGIPPGAIVFPDVYGYQIGWSRQQMAAAYTAFDVLLAPSRGEGFCVPLIEAQACGTPVICSDFSAQPELVGAGWIVGGQQRWDPPHRAWNFVASIDEVVARLEDAYTADLDAMAPHAIAKAAEYEADTVYDAYWRPLLGQMFADPEPPDLDRDEPFTVDVIVPLMRPENLSRLLDSFHSTADLGRCQLAIIRDDRGEPVWGDPALIPDSQRIHLLSLDRDSSTYAEKINAGNRFQHEGTFVLLVGDDVEFHPGWFEAAEKLADRYDVIGTNDSLPGRVRNPEVAEGTHADHFFVRRSYVEKYGASLEGPGILAPECYRHWFVDKEIIELAKARGCFSPCLDSIVEHHHPGYDNAPRDLVYQMAIGSGEEDAKTFAARRPLIDQQRQTRGKR